MHRVFWEEETQCEKEIQKMFRRRKINDIIEIVLGVLCIVFIIPIGLASMWVLTNVF